MCKQCKVKPVYEFTNKRKLCKRCFINYFQKKVFFIIRKFRMIKNGDIICYRYSKDFRDIVLQEVLNLLSEKSDIELIKFPTKKKSNKLAISSTIDLESREFVNKIIFGNVKELNNLKPINKNEIKPLYLFLDKEVFLYAKLKKLKFKKLKISLSKTEKFLEEFEVKHPELKRAIVNSLLKLDD